jgi:methylenetetrahydrofolate dehydrogenase (NADP+)/methenyltetrahydrofolate cyclohydrolase
MSARIIDGKAHAARLQAEIGAKARRLTERRGVVPALAAVLVGEDPASRVYVRNKALALRQAGMRGEEFHLAHDVAEAEVLELIARFNADAAVHGILLQLPLPKHIDAVRATEAVEPAKDVDGFHPQNVGKLALGRPAFVPCTPQGVLLLLNDVHERLAGLEAVVIGRSQIVGRPLAQLLLQQDCTVTIAHSKSRDLKDVCRRADILIAAAGRAELVRGDWIKTGATVIDVGINRLESGGKSRLVGDVCFDEAVKVAGWITPVPGGVGPMTIACLLANTLAAACRQAGVAEADLV